MALKIEGVVDGGVHTERSRVNLAHSDTGIVMLRRLLREQLQRIEQGLDPINVARDTSANKRIPTGAWNTILSTAEPPRCHTLARGRIAPWRQSQKPPGGRVALYVMAADALALCPRPSVTLTEIFPSSSSHAARAAKIEGFCVSRPCTTKTPESTDHA